MAELITVARPYAEAVFSLAREQKSLDKWSDKLAQLAVIAQDPDMTSLIADPERDGLQIRDLFASILGLEADDEVNNLVAALQDNGRLTLLPEIARQYEQLKNSAEGVLEAVVETAFPLNESQGKDLTAMLSDKYGKTVHLTIQDAPDLIGGVRILVGDDVIDGSVRGKLQAMAASLKN